jgi:integrase
MSPNSVRRHLRNLQAILDRAGPGGPRIRDAAEIIPKTPWVKPPRQTFKPPHIVTLDHLGAVYLAAVCAEIPNLWGFKPPAWWRALLVVAYNTGLRKGALFGMRIADINWQGQHLTLPPELSKTRYGQRLHLNGTTMRHLMAIRTDREIVFEWPHSYKHFHRQFEKIQETAALDPKDRFTLHDIRKTLATALWATSPQAAQWQLGHTGIGTTQQFYVQGDQMVADAIDRLPQPKAFEAA